MHDIRSKSDNRLSQNDCYDSIGGYNNDAVMSRGEPITDLEHIN